MIDHKCEKLKIVCLLEPLRFQKLESGCCPEFATVINSGEQRIFYLKHSKNSKGPGEKTVWKVSFLAPGCGSIVSVPLVVLKKRILYLLYDPGNPSFV